MKFFNIFKWHVWKSPSGLYYVRRKNLFGYEYRCNTTLIGGSITSLNYSDYQIRLSCSISTEEEARRQLNVLLEEAKERKL